MHAHDVIKSKLTMAKKKKQKKSNEQFQAPSSKRYTLYAWKSAHLCVAIEFRAICSFIHSAAYLHGFSLSLAFAWIVIIIIVVIVKQIMNCTWKLQCNSIQKDNSTQQTKHKKEQCEKVKTHKCKIVCARANTKSRLNLCWTAQST